MLSSAPLVFGIGQCSLDYIGLISSYPPPDVKCEFTDLVIQGGGPAASAMVALKRWGLNVHLAGVVGDDDFGKQIRNFLVAENIDTTGLVVRPQRQSQFAFIVSEPSLARRTIFWQRPTGEELKPDEINTDILLQSSACISTDFTEAAFGLPQKRREFRHSDAGTLRDGMTDIRLSDCVVTSEVFQCVSRNTSRHALNYWYGVNSPA